MSTSRILIAEDDETARHVLESVLGKHGYEVISASNAEQALEVLQKSPVDLIITDLHLPGASGIDLLKGARATYPETAVVVMTAFGTVQTAVDAMKAGAYDYLTKPIHPYELAILVSRALDHTRLVQEVTLLRTCLEQKYGFENIIGSSAALMRTLEIAARVAPADVTVLLHGETGTGKELIAKAIHFRSPRHDRPFVTVNCGSIPRELLESELFGHTKGSFTGAVTHKKGKAEAADGGTIFLDEIGELPLELQVRVLRLIQEHEIEKVGTTNAIKLDLRIIAATHRDLLAMVKAGTFREDLYYRLIVIPIEIPPLRDRAEDIPELVRDFLARFKVKHGRQTLGLSQEALRALCGYPWPGNVRQLENAVERMVLLAKGPEIGSRDLPDFIQSAQTTPDTPTNKLPEDGLDLRAMEKEMIIRALNKFGGNQSRAAHFLQLSRRTLAYRMEKYGISPGEFTRISNKDHKA